MVFCIVGHNNISVTLHNQLLFLLQIISHLVIYLPVLIYRFCLRGLSATHSLCCASSAVQLLANQRRARSRKADQLQQLYQ